MDAADPVSDFFMTWVQLMERRQDSAVLVKTLRELLHEATEPEKLQEHADKMQQNEQQAAELVTRLNEHFYSHVVPALEHKEPQTADTVLDNYLAMGETPEDAAEVDTSDHKDKRGHGVLYAVRNEEDASTDDEIPSDEFHDLLIRNNLRLTSLSAPEYAAPAARADETLPTRVVSPRGRPSKKAKRRRMVPPPIVTDLPARSAAGSAASTPMTQTRSPESAPRGDRIAKQTAANLVPEQVLGVRMHGVAKEYLIKWKGVETPLWISRAKSPALAKELIDLYAREMRARDEALSSGLNRAGSHRKQTSVRHGRKSNAAGKSAKSEEFFTVDHIVNHRTKHKKRQYLVRWENYNESEDTWQDAATLRADVPAIVDAYEEQLQKRQREQAPTKAVRSARSELTRDEPVTQQPAPAKSQPAAALAIQSTVIAVPAKSQSTPAESQSIANEVPASVVSQPVARKRAASESDAASTGNAKNQLVLGGKEASLRESVKRHRGNAKDGGELSGVDYQFDLEEAELEEYTGGEFADRLNTPF